MSNLRAVMIRCLVVTFFVVIPWVGPLWMPDDPALTALSVVAYVIGLSLVLVVWSGLDAWRNRDLPAIILRWAVVLAFIAAVDLAFTAIDPGSAEDVPVVVELLLTLISFAMLNVLPVVVGLGIGGLVRALQRPSPPVPGPAYYGHPVQSQWPYPYPPADGGHRTVDR